MNSVYILIFFTIICVECSKKLPTFVDQCFRGDTKELSKCLSRNVEKLRPKLKEGIPELFIPSLNPLMVPSAEIKSGDRFRCRKNNYLYSTLYNSFCSTKEQHLLPVQYAPPDIELHSKVKRGWYIYKIFQNQNIIFQKGGGSRLMEKWASEKFYEFCDLKNLKIYNVENSIVSSFNLELGDIMKWELSVENPCLNIETDFHVKGKLLVLQLDNDGTCIGNLTGLKVRTSGSLETIVKHGKQHLLGKNGDINMTLHSTYFHFDNLFKNNKALNDRTNQIFNENYNVFVEEFGPTIGNIIKTFLENILNRLYSKFPIDVLFPEKK